MDDELNLINNEQVEIQEEYIEVVEQVDLQQPAIPDGKHLVKKKRRERLIRKGRMKQERFRGFMRFFISLFLLLGLG